MAHDAAAARRIGVVSPDRLREVLTDDTALVSVMHANNEIGTIQPVAELAAIAHERGALMHTDAVQSAGKIPVDARARRGFARLRAQVQRPERRGRVVDQARHAPAAASDRREARAQPSRGHGECRRSSDWASRRRWPPRS
jgi:hypothetical protein